MYSLSPPLLLSPSFKWGQFFIFYLFFNLNSASIWIWVWTFGSPPPSLFVRSRAPEGQSILCLRISLVPLIWSPWSGFVNLKSFFFQFFFLLLFLFFVSVCSPPFLQTLITSRPFLSLSVTLSMASNPGLHVTPNEVTKVISNPRY